MTEGKLRDFYVIVDRGKESFIVLGKKTFKQRSKQDADRKPTTYFKALKTSLA